MENPVSWISDRLKKLKEDIWQSPFKQLSKKKSFLYKQLRIIYLAGKGFTKNKIQLRASALTFYSLLSLIPVVAIAFAIAKGFGLDQNLEELIIKEFESHQEILDWLLANARNALQETRGGYIAGVGAIILFYSVMSLLEHIEISFNHIWQVRFERPWHRKFTDYLTIMLISPVFIVLTSSITVFVSTELNDFMLRAPILEFFKPIISLLFKLTPYVLSWIIMTLLFIIMPNTKVRFFPAMISGIITGTILVVIQWLYIDLQFGISKLSAIYGSFAAIPLFIIWLQTTWIVVLIGAQLAFFNQNITKYELETENLDISNYQKKALVLMLMNLIVKNFAAGEKPISISQITTTLGIPNQIVNYILRELGDADLVSIIHTDEDTEQLYQPALDINRITINFVFQKLDSKGTEHKVVVKNKDYENIMLMLNRFDEVIAKSKFNILIKDL